MRGRFVALGVLALLLAGSMAPLAGGLDRALDGTMYTILTRFSDGTTESDKLYYARGANFSSRITVPAAAIIKTATVQVSGDLLDLEGSTTYDSTADFSSGKSSNMSVFNGSLLLRPFLDIVNYSAGASPAGIAAGDVNLDGRTDIIVVNSDGNFVGVFLQNATLGRLENQALYSVGQGPQGLAVGDLNRDGRQDVAIACSGLGMLDVLYQGSDGVLETGFELTSGNGTRAVAVGDLNLDGRTDAVTVNSVDRTLSLFLQDQNGNLNLAARFATGANPVAVAVGDVNLDGRSEAVVANKDDSTIDIFVQNSTTYLKKAYSNDTGDTPVSVAIGDLNRDGRNDVAVAEQGAGAIGVFLQTPAGVLGSRTAYDTVGAPYWVAADDLSFDGRTDLVAVSAATSKISVFYQKADGTLSPAEEYGVGAGPQCVATGDFNYDGKKDIACANTAANNISVLLMRPTPPGTIPNQQTVNAPTDPHGLRIADLNADGLQDIGLAAWSGSVLSIYPQTQAGALAQRTDYPAGGGSCVDLDFADFNVDGRNDLVTTSWNENMLSLFYQNNKGTLDPRLTVPIGTAYAMVATGDVNSDGRKDFVAAGHGNFLGTNISIFLGNASGGFDGPFNSSPGRVPTGVAIGDLNSDGLDDIAVTDQYDNNVAVYYQKRDGTLQNPQTRDTGRFPVGVAIADLSSDGRCDLVVVDGSGNTISVFIQDGSGKLPSVPTTYATGTSPYLVAAGDVDSDGRTDLIVSNINAANIGVFIQKPDGTLTAQTTYSTGGTSQPTGVAVGDINGDGKNDIAVANEVVNNLGLFRQKFSATMNGTYTSAFRPLPYEAYQATAFWNYTITGNGQNFSLELSNDAGATWNRAVLGEPLEFPGTGSSLGFCLKLTSGALNETPRFDNITIHYVMHSYPVDPSLDIGALGTPIWNWTGPFGISGQPATVDFTERLNATLEAGLPDEAGNITVSFILASGSLGELRLSNLVVAYDLAPFAPVLWNFKDNEFTTTQTPGFKMSAQDNDTSFLKFRLDISQDDFSTIRGSFSQLVTTDGWDKPAYRPGETATYQLNIFDKLTQDGSYQWRAYVWDGMVWSAPSDTGRFRLDTKAPSARVHLLPAFQNTTRFNLSWAGSDPDPGSGLDPDYAFDIQYKDRESSPWLDWQVGTNLTTAEFVGMQGKTYYFQARARDIAGNLGSYLMGGGDTRTLVDVTPPVGTITDDGETTSSQTKLHASFSFTDLESDVVRYEYGIGTFAGPGGNDTFGPVSTDKIDVAVSELFLRNGTRYFFNIRAQNGAGVWSPIVSSDGILVRLKMPYATLVHSDGVQAEIQIELALGSTDPNGVGIEEGDLEYRVASIQNRAPVDWSSWQEIGGSDWGDAKPSDGPWSFTGEPGKAYRFRYRVRDNAATISDFAEPPSMTRINRPPLPGITPVLKATAGKTVLISANETIDPDGDPLVYSWDFGDGRTGFGREVKHTFVGARKYTVTVYVDDQVANVSSSMVIDVKDAPHGFAYTYLLAPLALFMIIAAAAGVFVLSRRRKARPGRLPAGGEAHPEYAPVVVPGSERPAPAPPPPTAAEVEAQILAARGEMAELEELGVEVARTSKMLGLAESFYSDGSLDLASQYASKTIRLARDQKQRKESEVDEDTARRFINETQRMLDGAEASGVKVKEAKKLLGLSISFMADGNYVTGMQYSKKVRKMLEELRERDRKPPATADNIQKQMASVTALAAELRKGGGDPSPAEEELATARMFLDEGDLPPAMEHIERARALCRELGEKERPLSPQQWKERVAHLRDRIESGKDDGLRTAEPMKMLKFSESFALQGNLEVATQYVRKAEKLMDDMQARAKVDAARPEQEKGPLVCPRCGEEVEADWMVCAYCNNKMKQDVLGAEAESGARTLTADPRQAAAGEPKAPKVARPVEEGPDVSGVRIALPVAGDEGFARKAAKVARPVEEEAPPPLLKCPSCEMDLEPEWKICPACETPIVR